MFEIISFIYLFFSVLILNSKREPKQDISFVLTKLLLNFISNPNAFFGAGSISGSGSWPFSRALFRPKVAGEESVDLGLGDQLDMGADSTWGTNWKIKNTLVKKLN